MVTYSAPLDDIHFLLYELLDYEGTVARLPGYEEATEDLMEAILEEGAKFSENVLSPLNQSGDEEGCTWDDGVVTTPEGFADAYRQYVENGWPADGPPVLGVAMDVLGMGLDDRLWGGELMVATYARFERVGEL